MLIDWFTVIAQVINFLLLVWLMKRFLYQPILDAIHQREKTISEQIKSAQLKETEAQKERDLFQKKNEDFDAQKDTLLQKSVSEAEVKRAELLRKAREEYETLRARYQASVKNEQAHFENEVIDKATEEVFSVVRKTLSDLANTSLEEQIVKVFIKKLETTNAEEFKKNLASANQPVSIKSVFEFQPKQRQVIEQAVKKRVPENTKIEFVTNTKQIAGVELSANGYKITWNINDYLSVLEQHISEHIEETNSKTSKA